ncbi:protein translocase subunit SecF [Candidatus Deianiraea vastatrix]|uniref:Protein translocase subunit SecF n=1 Tax=Candidatus Deianiraea vastatrix TaxID=2163644 RepID=A0A5B8XES4_9RICK|nr:protein translocase subunit SecF [Candidatus Deianiraea vastatrix]QED23466.1 Preprotein translocase subunit SecF [Candidatus Deianiraea vastatrix]
MIDFNKKASFYIFFAIFTFIASLIFIRFYSVKLSLDFTGGGVVFLDKNIDIAKISGVTKVDKSDNFGSILYFQNDDFGIFQEHLKSLSSEVSKNGVKIVKTDFVGEKFGKTALITSLYGLFFALLAIFLYIFIKFGLNLSIVATFGLIYNCIIVVGIASLFKIEFDLMSISALLTLIGYCINDTVVVFDRVQEIAMEFNSSKDKSDYKIINGALNKVISRSLKTSIITAIGIMPMIIFSQNEIRNFAIMIICGIVFGTIYSIFAAPILLKLGKFKIKLRKIKSQLDDPMRYV